MTDSTPFSDDDVRFMRLALQEAERAAELDEVPVGAVIVAQGQVIARAHNLCEQLRDFTAHAEMQAFTAASEYLGGKFLDKCTLYVTLEPCPMCAGAAFWTRIGRVVYGAKDEKRGHSKFDGRGSLWFVRKRRRTTLAIFFMFSWNLYGETKALPRKKGATIHRQAMS